MTARHSSFFDIFVYYCARPNGPDRQTFDSEF